MFRRLIASVSIATAVVATVATFGSSRAAVAAGAGGVVLMPGVSYVEAMLADPTHGEVFVGGHGGLAVPPVDATWAPAAVPGAPKTVTALALSHDGATVWAGGEDGSVTSFDAADPGAGPLRTFPAPAGLLCIGGLAASADGRVWATGGPCGKSAPLAVLDPATGTWTADVATTLFGRNLVAPATVGIDSGTGTTLVVAEDGYTARKALLASVDVSADPVTVVSKATDDAGSYRLAVAPDGATVVVGRGQRNAERYDTAHLDDVAARQVFDTSGASSRGPNAPIVALSQDGQFLATDGMEATTFGPLPSSTSWLRSCAGPNLVDVAWAGDALFGVHGGGPEGVELHRCDRATVPQSLIVVTQPVREPIAGQPFTFGVSVLNHGQPVASAAVSVIRHTMAGGERLPSVTTDARGHATVPDVVPAVGAPYYELTYAGDTQYEAYSTAVTVYIGSESTTIVLSAPKKVALDGSTIITARLGVSTTSQPIAAMRLRVVRTDASGRHPVATATTDQSGRITVRDHPHVGGAVTYEVRFDGNAGMEPAHESRTVVVSRLVPRISVTMVHRVVAYGGTSVARVHLSHTRGRKVWVVAHPAAGRSWLITVKSVDSKGNLDVRVKVTKRMTITASYRGDYRYGPASSSGTQRVRAALQIRMAGGRGRSGAVALYHSRDWFEIIATLRPVAARACVRFDRGYRSAGQWHSLGRTACSRDADSGTAVGQFDPSTTGAIGVLFRFRAVYAGSRYNAAVASSWVYAKVVA